MSSNRNKYKFSSIPPLVLIGQDVIRERGNQGQAMVRELSCYDILLKDLANMDVCYSIKNELLNIAFYIVNDVECYEKFERDKDIPSIRVCKEFVKTKRFINEWKDYIIAYTVILGDPKYKYLQDYLRVVEDEEYEEGKVLDIFSGKDTIKGIVISCKGKNAIIMTSLGEFKKVKLEEAVSLGEEVSGVIKKAIRDYKMHLALLASMAIILLGTFAFRYTKVVSTVMVKTTSPILLEVNAFNRVKSINSDTERGKKLVSSIDVLDRSLDIALLNIIKYANENEMMPQEGIVVAVNGEPIEYGILNKTEDYIYVEQVDVRLNNSGIEQKFN